MTEIQLKKYISVTDSESKHNSNGGLVVNEGTNEIAGVRTQTDNMVAESEQAELDRTWALKLQLVKSRMKTSMCVLLAIAYFGYFFYAMYCNFGDEGSIRLLTCTMLGVFYISGITLLKRERVARLCKAIISGISNTYSQGKIPVITRWALYLIFTLGCVAFIVINVGMNDPDKLRSLIGMVVFVLGMVLVSKRKRKINWHTVFWGFMLQFLLGIFVLKSDAGKSALNWASARLLEFMDYSKSGSLFLFGPKYVDHPFAFIVLPQIITFCAAVQLLIYLGTIEFIVKTLGRLVAFVLDVSAPEAMNACANILLGGAESTMIVRSYLDKMPAPQLFAVLTNNGASCGGSALIQFMLFGASPDYLLSASIMSVPAALTCAKIMYPDDEDIDDHGVGEKQDANEKPSTQSDSKGNSGQGSMAHSGPQQPRGLIEAIVIGAKTGLSLSANIIGILTVFNAMVGFLDATVAWFGDRINIDITMTMLLGYVFYPIAYLMGVDVDDCETGGRLLGIKIIANPIFGYEALGVAINNRHTFEDYTAVFNSSQWHYDGNDIYLENWNQTLTDGYVSEQSELVLTYALCGFASLTSLGGAIAVLGALVPSRLNDISRLAIPALIAGSIASFLTACVAGLIA